MIDSEVLNVSQFLSSFVAYVDRIVGGNEFASGAVIAGYTPILVQSHKEDSAAQSVKEFISLKRLGRNHKFFDDMIRDIDKRNEDDTKTKYYAYKKDYQDYITKQPKRSLDTVMLPKKDLDNIINVLDQFDEQEDWYLKHQVPYQLGILLHGPPGTGKTSLIKAIASYADRDITYVNDVENLSNAAQRVNDSIIVAEEIDTFGLERGRESEDDFFMGFGKKALRDVLNAMDGIISNHGRILIMTTNHPEVLDEAMVRPGRIDLHIEIGYMITETFNCLLSRFFDDYEVTDRVVKEGTTAAMVQNDVILGFLPADLIKKYTI